MWLSYETGQTLLIVFFCLVIIGFVLWLFADLNVSKKLKFIKKKAIIDDEEK